MIVHVRFHVRVSACVYIFRFKGSADPIHFIFEVIVGSDSFRQQISLPTQNQLNVALN